MAKTDHAAELHRSICKRLIMTLSDLLKSPSDFLDYLIETGCVDASRLYEVVSSVREGIPLDSVEGRDLADGSNCKLTAAYGPVNGQRTAYGWIIKVTNCTGDVRAIFTRPKTGETYEALIPFKEHQYQKYITITECKRGPKFGRWTEFVRSIA